ncbi:aldo/keto reductase [Nonomuraea sp. NPDC050227]|uniref:aldo/keto reductase n=1 Tax=Nonomuraea sp. NPDC050227 TaxID=3364360 RepID=UPI0037AC2826
MTLPATTLGRTGLRVSRLGYGAMELRGPRAWGPPVSDDAARAVLNEALDAGVNLIDTAPDYGDAEEHIGRWIAHRRDEFVLAGKCGCSLTDGDPAHDYTRANVRAGVERSLRRMRTGHLDVLMVHLSPSVSVMAAEDTVAGMRELQDEGLIRFTGMSGELPHLPEHIATGAFDVFLLPYSALDRSHEGLVGAAAASGAGTIARGAVARSLAPPPEAVPEPVRRPLAQRHARLAAARLEELADGAPVTELLLRFILGHPELHSVIVGSARPEHLRANVAAARKGPLPPDVEAAVRARLGPA